MGAGTSVREVVAMKWLLGLLVVVVLSPALVMACPPPATPDYTGPDVSSGPAPSDPATGGSDGDEGDADSDDIIDAPGDISTDVRTL
jgi:hypothetical protein